MYTDIIPWKTEKELFEKYFIKHNPIIRQNNNQINIQIWMTKKWIDFLDSTSFYYVNKARQL